jgi:peptide/nickel transport system substrate-binding protein
MLTRRALMAAGAAVATAPFASNRGHAATPRDMIVVARQIDDIISFDPAQSYDFNEDVDANIYRKLVSPDLSSLTQIRPDLAEHWEVSSDGKHLPST